MHMKYTPGGVLGKIALESHHLIIIHSYQTSLSVSQFVSPIAFVCGRKRAQLQEWVLGHVMLRHGMGGKRGQAGRGWGDRRWRRSTLPVAPRASFRGCVVATGQVYRPRLLASGGRWLLEAGSL